ncbi:MAG: alpha/beta hydrolase [Syntrophaceae bacterium]
MIKDFPVEDFFIRAAGRRLQARRLGRHNKGPALVFLHEGLGSIAQWRDFPELLCRKAGLPGLIYDRLGYGGSEPINEKRRVEYLHEEALASLPEVLQKCHVGKALFVGHSDGGSIALLFAAVHPERTAGVITEAAHVFVEDVTVDGIRAAVALYERGDLKEKLARYHAGNTEGAFRGWADTWLAPEFRNWNIEEYLSSIHAPLLAIQGCNDPYGTPAQVKSIVSRVNGPARGLIIPGCGHIPHIQAKQRVLSEMAEFVLEHALVI